jgi:hypothetical protein
LCDRIVDTSLIGLLFSFGLQNFGWQIEESPGIVGGISVNGGFSLQP